MRNFYSVTFSIMMLAILAGSCSKDFLKSYEDRIVGTWELKDVDHRGIGGERDNLPFLSGEFVFADGGQLTYTNILGTIYSGSWGIDDRYETTGYSTNENGNTTSNEQRVWALEITAIAFASQEIRSEYFEEIKFTGTNSFRAFVRNGLHTYVFYFERK